MTENIELNKKKAFASSIISFFFMFSYDMLFNCLCAAKVYNANS